MQAVRLLVVHSVGLPVWPTMDNRVFFFFLFFLIRWQVVSASGPAGWPGSRVWVPPPGLSEGGRHGQCERQCPAGQRVDPFRKLQANR
jgi:hypothetical protein